MTTHWAFCEELRQQGDLEVLEKVRFVHDGKIVTSAGVSAGIDMALWLVGQIHGIAHARQTQHIMEYDPAPPHAAEPACSVREQLHATRKPSSRS